jgi:hypothetical protein
MPLECPWFAHPWFRGGTLEVNLFESADGLPGRVLESFSSTAMFGPDVLTTFTSQLQPQLVAGLLYFLEARAVGEANGLWYLTTADFGGNFLDYRRNGNAPWTVGRRQFEAAFRISGDAAAAPVPEPATLVLVGSGMALAALRRRRR